MEKQPGCVPVIRSLSCIYCVTSPEDRDTNREGVATGQRSLPPSGGEEPAWMKHHSSATEWAKEWRNGHSQCSKAESDVQGCDQGRVGRPSLEGVCVLDWEDRTSSEMKGGGQFSHWGEDRGVTCSEPCFRKIVSTFPAWAIWLVASTKPVSRR